MMISSNISLISFGFTFYFFVTLFEINRKIKCLEKSEKPNITKLNTREKLQKAKIVKLNTREMIYL